MRTARVLFNNKVLDEAHGHWETPGYTNVPFSMPVFSLLNLTFNLEDVPDGEFVPVSAFLPHLLSDNQFLYRNDRLPGWRLGRPGDREFAGLSLITERNNSSWNEQVHPLMQYLLAVNSGKFQHASLHVGVDGSGQSLTPIGRERIKFMLTQAIEEVVEQFEKQLTEVCEQAYNLTTGHIRVNWSLANHATEGIIRDSRTNHEILNSFLGFGIERYHEWVNYCRTTIGETNQSAIKYYTHAGLLLAIPNSIETGDIAVASGFPGGFTASGPNFAFGNQLVVSTHRAYNNMCRPSVLTELGFSPAAAVMVKKEQLHNFIIDMLLGTEKASIKRDDMAVYVSPEYAKILSSERNDFNFVEISTPGKFWNALTGNTKEKRLAFSRKELPPISDIVKLANEIANSTKYLESPLSRTYSRTPPGEPKSTEYKISKYYAGNTIDIVS